MFDLDDELAQQWVYPYYFDFMSGRFLRDEERYHSVRSRLLQALGEIDDPTIYLLLTHRNWRYLLAGACFTGLNRRCQFVPIIRDLLLANDKYHAQWGYQFALVRCGDSLRHEEYWSAIMTQCSRWFNTPPITQNLRL